jgi:hypothetical protein
MINMTHLKVKYEAKILDDTADAELCRQFKVLQDTGRW